VSYHVGAAADVGQLLALAAAIRRALVPALIGCAAGVLLGAAVLDMITTALARFGCGHPAQRSWGAVLFLVLVVSGSDTVLEVKALGADVRVERLA
jgi:hypothetical protein